MKKKIVLWGNDGEDKKILIALELKAEENKVNIYTFDEGIATEDFYNQMMDQWRADKEVTFPEGHKLVERPLSMTDDLLPEDIKVMRADLITRAKTEWHFAVLSSKLYDMYHTEIEDIKEKVSRLTSYDNGIWNELIGYWDKLNNQIKERNLFREQADLLRDKTNILFNQLKELRTKANAEFATQSSAKLEEYKVKLNDINERVEKGLGLKPIFEELKTIQTQFRDEKLTKGDRNKLWKNIDILFKKVKEKKYGKQPEGASNNNVSRVERRYQGLLSAIEKMERSINRDKQDIEFQNRRVGQTDGQLEAQIRQAKVKMIEGRIESKNEKLQEMLSTKVDLEKRVEKEKQRAIKDKEKQEIQKKKKEVKKKIAAEIEEKSQNVDNQKLEAAASAIKESKTAKKKAPKESILGTLATMAGEALEDAVDTIKAVGEVVGDKIEEKLDDVKETVSEIAEDVSEKSADIKEAVADKIEDTKEAIATESADSAEGDTTDTLKKGGLLGAAVAAGGLLVKKATEKAHEMKDKAEDLVEDAKEAVSDMTANASDKTTETTESISERKAEVVESVTSSESTTEETVSEVVQEVSEESAEVKEAVAEKVEETKETIAAESADSTKVDTSDSLKKGGLLGAAVTAGGLLVNKVTEKAQEIKDKAGDLVEDAKEALGDITSEVKANDAQAVETVSESVDIQPDESVNEVVARLSDEEE